MAPSGKAFIDHINILTFDGVTTNKLPDGKRVQDYREWEYDNSDRSSVYITFNSARTAVVAIQCYSRSTYACPSVLGVSDGDGEREVLDRLGKPSSSRFIRASKYISYDDLGVHFVLSKEKAYFIAVTQRGHELD